MLLITQLRLYPPEKPYEGPGDPILQKVETKIISSQFTPEPKEENSVTKKPACDDRVMCIGTYCQLRFS